MRTLCLLSGAALMLVACQKTPEPTPAPVPKVSKTPTEPAKADPTRTAPAKTEPAQMPPATRLPLDGRLVAMGDVHGDLNAMKNSLRVSGLLDAQDHWKGGQTTLVQTGDLLDRGDDERAIIDFLERLQREAEAEGGRVVRLNGNHEIMNVAGDLRYVTAGGFEEFKTVQGLDLSAPALQRLPEASRARAAAFAPGGPYALKLAHADVTVVVGDTAFAHGGILPKHVREGLADLNEETRQWMLGKRASPPEGVTGPDSVVWTRLYSQAETAEACETLDEMLAALKVKRLVVGHTVQRQGVTSACEEKVWRIDVGMASHYGGSPQALEIVGDKVTILK